MKFPSLASRLRLLKPFKTTEIKANSTQIDEFTLYDKIEEIASIANYDDSSIEIVKKFYLLTEIQQQLTIVTLIEHNMIEALEKILFSKYNVNFLIRGQTPLHFAIKDQNLNMIRILIKYNADIELEDTYKETALNCAVRTGYIEIIKYLLEQGAEVNTHASDSTTPLEIAIYNRDAASVNMLKKYGAHLGNSYLIKKI